MTTTRMPAISARLWLAAGLTAAIMATGIGVDAMAAQGGHETDKGARQWKAVERRIDRDGSARVIVKLDVKAAPTHTLSATRRRNQKSRIAAARKGLVSDISRGQKRRKVRSAAHMPVVVLNIKRRDVAALRESEHVAGVTLDQLVAHTPFESGTSRRRSLPVAGAASPRNHGPTEPVAKPARTSKNGWYTQLRKWWHFDRIGLSKARDNGAKGYGQAVAILDTGVKRNHPWLAGRVTQEACFSWAGDDPDVGFCPGGLSQVVGPGTAGPMCWRDYCEAHGTGIAHVAAGRRGVAPKADIIAVQVFHPVSDGRGGYGVSAFSSDIYFGMYWVYTLVEGGQTNIAAVNLSLGNGRYRGHCDEESYLTELITALRDLGTATVIASGNDNRRNSVSHPACVTDAITVGNTTKTRKGADAVLGRVPGGSNSSELLDLLAPGTDICTAVLKRKYSCSYTGTSLAAPQVAGAIAVLRQKRPSAPVDEIQAVLTSSGKRVRDTRNGIKRSRIHVYRAWKALAPPIE